MKKALVFGASGQIGAAVAAELACHGWSVDAVTRGGRGLPFPAPEGVRLLQMQDDRAAVIRAKAGGYDGVFDPLCYDEAGASDLLSVGGNVGSFCVVSTASVYSDSAGRSLESADESGFPAFPDYISENQPTVPPGQGYSAGKVAMERRLRQSSVPVSILRPAAVHGVGARHPREWWFVKRLLDGRKVIPVTYGGLSVFHTSSVQGIASLARLCLERRLAHTLNVADPVALNVREIGMAIGRTLGLDFSFYPVDDLATDLDHVGSTPWSAETPLRLDVSLARSLGWDGGPTYESRLPALCDWLLQHRHDWQAAFPVFQRYGHDPFDYQGEDRAMVPVR